VESRRLRRLTYSNNSLIIEIPNKMEIPRTRNPPHQWKQQNYRNCSGIMKRRGEEKRRRKYIRGKTFIRGLSPLPSKTKMRLIPNMITNKAGK